jgi:hypothetical protein
MTDSGMTKPTRGIALLVVGIILTVIGLAIMITLGWGTPGKNTALNHVIWESSVWIGSAAFVGVGILLIVIAIVRRRSRASRMRDGSLPGEPGAEQVSGQDPHDTGQHRH